MSPCQVDNVSVYVPVYFNITKPNINHLSLSYFLGLVQESPRQTSTGSRTSGGPIKTETETETDQSEDSVTKTDQ